MSSKDSDLQCGQKFEVALIFFPQFLQIFSLAIKSSKYYALCIICLKNTIYNYLKIKTVV